MGSPKSDLRTLGLSLGVVSEESAVVFTWGSPAFRFNNKHVISTAALRAAKGGAEKPAVAFEFEQRATHRQDPN